MSYTVKQHENIPMHYYVNGTLVAGAVDEADAVRIYEEAKNASDSPEPPT